MLNKKRIVGISLLILFSFLLSVFSFASEEILSYSLDDLILKGLQTNPSLKSAEFTVESVEIVRDMANLNLSYIPSVQFFTSPQPMIVYKQKLALDRAYDNARDNVQIEIDSTRYEVIKKYQAVLNATESLKVAEENMQYQRSLMDIAILKYNMGMLSSIEKMVAVQTYDMTKKAYDLKGTELDKAYQNLNDVLGFADDYRYKLEPSKFADIDKGLKDSDYEYLLSLGNDNLIIKILERNLEGTQFNYDFYVYNVGDKPLDAIEKDINAEEYTIINTKDALAESIRTLFINAQQIQKNYQDLLMKDETDRKLHEIREIQYELGMITKMDIMASEKTLLENEANLIALRNGYNEIIFMLNYPHVASRS